VCVKKSLLDVCRPVAQRLNTIGRLAQENNLLRPYVDPMYLKERRKGQAKECGNVKGKIKDKKERREKKIGNGKVTKVQRRFECVKVGRTPRNQISLNSIEPCSSYR
jgi:hypothetical protein